MAPVSDEDYDSDNRELKKQRQRDNDDDDNDENASHLSKTGLRVWFSEEKFNG